MRVETVTTLTTESRTEAAPRDKAAVAYWPRIKPILLAVAFPLLLLAIWHFATVNRPASLIPPPYDVWQELKDLAVGGINDDGHRGPLLPHLPASISRVYGGFALALTVSLPLGLLIGRVPLVRQLID